MAEESSRKRVQSEPKIQKADPFPVIFKSLDLYLMCYVAKLQSMEHKLDQARAAGTIGHMRGMGDRLWKIEEKILQKDTSFGIWIVHYWKRHKLGEYIQGFAEECSHYLEHGKLIIGAVTGKKDFQSTRKEPEYHQDHVKRSDTRGTLCTSRELLKHLLRREHMEGSQRRQKRISQKHMLRPSQHSAIIPKGKVILLG